MRRFIVLVVAAFTVSGAQAACFEDLGQTGCTDREVFPRADLRQLSCDNLWLVRNTIYSENGYCFRTDRALRYFDNSGCYVEDAEDVKEVHMNRFESSNIDRIVGIERQKGCR